MCKNKLLILFFLTTFSFADVFENNCLICHPSGQLNMFLSKYTLEYSSKSQIFKAMKEYLKNPSYEKSIMPRGFLNRFGLKTPTTLSDDELIQALQIYIEKYNYSNKLY